MSLEDATKKFTQLQILEEVKKELDDFCLTRPHLKKLYIASYAIRKLISAPPEELEIEMAQQFVQDIEKD